MKIPSNDILPKPRKAQFTSGPEQVQKAASVQEALAAASELQPRVGKVRQFARERRAALARHGKNALPPA